MLYRFILLRDPDPKKIDFIDSKMIGIVTNTLTNEALIIELKSEFDTKYSNDNPVSFFPTSIEAAYFWVSGDWIQRDKFDFWAIRLFSILASIVIVILLQNLLIAFMR